MWFLIHELSAAVAYSVPGAKCLLGTFKILIGLFSLRREEGSFKNNSHKNSDTGVSTFVVHHLSFSDMTENLFHDPYRSNNSTSSWHVSSHAGLPGKE